MKNQEKNNNKKIKKMTEKMFIQLEGGKEKR